MIRLKNIYSIITSLLAMLIFVGCQPKEPENLTFGDWDEDGDGVIRESEFVEIFNQHYFDDWNRTEDEYLDDEDFHHVIYSVWDADNDDLLSQDEWIMGYDYYYGNYVVRDYDDIDVDDDGFISREEFNEVLRETDFFTDWDVDKDEKLTDAELAKQVFQRWDTDNSHTLSREEYEEFDTYYLDI